MNLRKLTIDLQYIKNINEDAVLFYRHLQNL